MNRQFIGECEIVSVPTVRVDAIMLHQSNMCKV